MHKGQYVFTQLVNFLPRYEFNKCVKYNNGDFRVRSFFCWDQFLAMMFGQLSYRNSLRDITNCLNAHKSKHYHLCFRSSVARSTLAEANEKRPWRIYRDFAQVLIKQARKLYEEDSDFVLDLDNTVYAFDSSTISLCLEVFPWARFRKKKAGIKLHTQIDLRGNIPTFMHITEARTNDVTALDKMEFEVEAIYVMDRAYTDTERLHDMNNAGAFFVVRDKKNLKWKRIYSHKVDKSTGVQCDQTIRFTGTLSYGGYPKKLRRVKYRDLESKQVYVFLTNNFTLDAKLIADLYKERWKVELFFKWIKQHLEVQVFWGTSLNAIHTQVWIAVSVYVLVSIIKKNLALDNSIYEILQILSVSLFDKTPLERLFASSDLLTQKDVLQNTLF